jgi:hypothetical protein
VPLVFEFVLLAVVVMLAMDGRRSSLKYAVSWESVLVAGVCPDRTFPVKERSPGDS